ncbi:MAG: TPM domain-containing protein [Oscillospiraceae bacterium]|nr:TPM domain-containing protein [Oscillospiraceae bacterium]
MQKFLCLFLISAVLMTGCQKQDTVPVSGKLEIIKESAAVTEPEPETEPETHSIEERAEYFSVPEHPYLFDECGGLSEKEAELHNAYLEWLSVSRLMNAFVVITDHLNGSSPEQFAAEYYKTVADPELPDGFLVLINNDTNRDYIFTAGTCSTYLPQTQAAVLLSGATYDLIEADYADALEKILPEFEKIPAYVCDRTGTLTEAELQEFSDKIQTIQKEKELQCAVILLPFPAEGEPDTDFYLKKFSCDAVLLLDPAKKLCRTAGDDLKFQDSEIIQVWEKQSLPWAVRFFLENI